MANTAVKKDFDFAACRFDHTGQGVQRAYRPVHLAAAVVRHNDSIHTRGDRGARVIRVDNPLHQHRQGGLPAERPQVVPGLAAVCEDLRPLRYRGPDVVFRHRFESFAKHGVGGVVGNALTLQEGQVRLL